MGKHLILGGGGFIGSHLAKRLKAQGNDVTVVDIEFPEYRCSQWMGIKTRTIDLRDYINTGRELFWFKEPYDVVWQLAADMGGVEYFHGEHDWQAAVNNQMINASVMAAIGHHWVKKKPRVVFTSTACALAVEKQTHKFKDSRDMDMVMYTEGWPLTEDDIKWGTPDQLYGQEKRNSALLWQAAPIDSRVCFLHTVYGPYQEKSGIRMKFPSAIAQKARKARDTGTIELFGDGKQVRTYLYITDAIDRLLALGNSTTDPGYVNIGGTKPYTVDEVAEIAVHAAFDGCPDNIVFNHIDGPTGVEARGCDMTKFNAIFPIPYNTVRLEDGMKRFIDWLDDQE